MLRRLFEPSQLFVRELPDDSRGDARREAAGRDYEAFPHKRSRGYETVLAYSATVKENCSHPDKGTIFDSAAVDNCGMSDSHIRSYNSREFFMRNVNHTVILDIRPVSYPDVIHVAAYDCVEPEAGIFADDDVAYHMDALGYEDALVQLRFLPEIL